MAEAWKEKQRHRKDYSEISSFSIMEALTGTRGSQTAGGGKGEHDH